jgi:putative MATE family efflux protein
MGEEPKNQAAESRNTRSLTEGSIRKHLMRMTVPMTWGILAIISKSLVDTFFVAQLGIDALTAISFTFPVSMTVTSLAIGMGAGAASVVSRVIGQGDQHLVRRRATDALVLSVVLVVVVALLGLLSLRPMFSLLGATGPILDLVESFMRVWYVGIPFLVVPMVGNSLIRAAGDGRIPGLIMVLAAFINLVLDPILIFGLLGAPALGIAGAAWATVIANAVTLIASLAVLHFRERLLDGGLPEWKEVAQSWAAILHVGIPASAANMINPIGLAFITRLLAQKSDEAVAAFGLVTRIEAVAVVGLFALSATIGPIVGQNWGAGQVERVHLALRRVFSYCLSYGLAVAVLVAILAPFLGQLFSDSPSVIDLTRIYLWVVPITLMGYGINITGAAAFNALGRPLIATGLTFGRMGLIYIPAAILLGHSYGVIGVFVAAAIANLGAAGITLLMSRVAISRPSTV